MAARAEPDEVDRPADVASAVVRAALQAMLNAFRASALVGRRGELVCANGAGRTFFGRGGVSPDLSCRQWEVRQLAGAGARDWSLLVWRAEKAERAPARREWGLTRGSARSLP